VDHVIYLTKGPTLDQAWLWITEDLSAELDRALDAAHLGHTPFRAMFAPGLDPALYDAVGRAISGLSAAGAVAALARIIHLVIHRNDAKEVNLALDDGRILESAGLSLDDIQHLLEHLPDSQEPTETQQSEITDRATEES
jgi:hypothetical protein